MSPSYAALSLPSFSAIQKGRFWSTFVAFARSTIVASLDKGIKEGLLEIADCDGTTREFGTRSPASESAGYREGKLIIKDETFWVRVYLSYDVGFSEAYMNDEVSSPCMKEVLNIYIDNFRHMSGVWSLAYKAKSIIDRIIIHRFLSHGLNQSILNVAGYDAANDLYKAFLSQEMQYSCPIWSDEEGGVRGDLTGRRSRGDLERAQQRKIEYVLKKARILPGHRVLEIGSGWGSLAIAAAEMGCSVDSLTLSIEQKVLAEERVKKAGFESQIRIHLMDYRKMPPSFEKAFDACIALEMVEAVGVPYMPTFIKTIDWALKDGNAAVVLSATCYPDAMFSPYQGDDFIRKYHWPYAIPLSATWLAQEFQATVRGRLSLESVEDYGPHYCRCLREWTRRLKENWTPELISSLQERYPEFLDTHVLNAYKRRWLYMFVYMEVVYSRVWLTLHYWTFVRPGYPAIECS
ncbi:S-adenosyl-L-methionine-dependent methyltransferase [Armillaria solidipes]|uniref:S-adenosyl-L-methionine-dependent methyltransferase n=1 Tax=Armillaria solidipes TaxID=1076256 RepID=A0A2H3B7Y3_9AGAR|nr:S-adenosyl-L-methionine-dependent methyltransferase [Armillaria solidipes]